VGRFATGVSIRAAGYEIDKRCGVARRGAIDQ